MTAADTLRAAAAHLRREHADSDGDAWASIPRAALPLLADLLDDEQAWAVDHVHTYPENSHLVRLAREITGSTP